PTGAPRFIKRAQFETPAGRPPAPAGEHPPPPRVHDRFGEGRHAIEAHTSPREKAALQFATMLGSYLKRAHDEQRYRELVLIAPPGFLGALNAALGARLGETVLSRVSKDLTRSPANEIRKALPHGLFKHRTFANG
ncbi:MAG: host attachment protein, partial [Rhodanobacteraceae bacterium]